jgi:uncharacterized protein (TIGR02117 family)
MLAAILTCSGCALPNMFARFGQSEPLPVASYDAAGQSSDEEETKTIYVVSHGWHTGLVLKTADLSTELFPGLYNIYDSDYIELGWGDEGFYTAKKITAPLVLKAALLPTPSVMHVAGFRGPVERFYQVSDIIEVELQDEQFNQLCAFVNKTFARTEDGEPITLGPGLYGDSTFYRAQGSYYFPKTCNIWTANALKHADCAIIPQIATTADNVLSQSKKFGHVLQKSPDGLKKAALQGGE